MSPFCASTGGGSQVTSSCVAVADWMATFWGGAVGTVENSRSNHDKYSTRRGRFYVSVFTSWHHSLKLCADREHYGWKQKNLSRLSSAEKTSEVLERQITPETSGCNSAAGSSWIPRMCVTHCNEAAPSAALIWTAYLAFKLPRADEIGTNGSLELIIINY